MKLMVVLLGLFNNICLNLRKLYAKINRGCVKIQA